MLDGVCIYDFFYLKNQIKAIWASITHRDGIAPRAFLFENGLVNSMQRAVGKACLESNGHACIEIVSNVMGGVITTSRIDG